MLLYACMYVWGSFSSSYEALHGQALKAMGRLKYYLVRYPNMLISHKLDLFNKLIEPVLSNGFEVWGMNNETK